MRVSFRGILPDVDPRERAFVSPSQLRLRLNGEYEVHAVSVFDGVVFLQVVDDLQTPTFLPRSLFVTVDATIPGDWIASTVPDGGLQLIVGPEFMASSREKYDAMIDQSGEQLQRFWSRVEGLQSTAEEGE